VAARQSAGSTTLLIEYGYGRTGAAAGFCGDFVAGSGQYHSPADSGAVPAKPVMGPVMPHLSDLRVKSSRRRGPEGDFRLSRTRSIQGFTTNPR